MLRSVLVMIVIMMDVFALENHKIEPDFVKDGNYMGIKILDSKVLTLARVDGLKFFGISDIAYDKSRDIFYALSDKGRIFKLSIKIENKKIKSLKALSGNTLKDAKGRKLFGAFKDSEGLALVGDSLLVSFERKPRLILYDDKLKPQKKLTLPKKLRDIKNYRGKNYALESLTYDKKHGFITAPEYPLKSQKKGYHDIYTKKGKLCTVKIEDKNHAITEMEMMPDGDLMLLTRKFSFRSFTFETMLVKVNLKERNSGVCQSEILAWMSAKKGWHIDNFEGLTHLYDNLYMMISDDNNNPFEKTILTLFELK